MANLFSLSFSLILLCLWRRAASVYQLCLWSKAKKAAERRTVAFFCGKYRVIRCITGNHMSTVRWFTNVMLLFRMKGSKETQLSVTQTTKVITEFQCMIRAVPNTIFLGFESSVWITHQYLIDHYRLKASFPQTCGWYLIVLSLRLWAESETSAAKLENYHHSTDRGQPYSFTSFIGSITTAYRLLHCLLYMLKLVACVNWL